MPKLIRVTVNGEALAQFPTTKKGEKQCLNLLNMLREEQLNDPYFQSDEYWKAFIERSRQAIASIDNPEGTQPHWGSYETRNAPRPGGIRPPELMCVATQIIEQ